MLSLSKSKGFTLIELLVAISIIAIISAIGITSYSQAQKLARDSKRKQDLRAIAIALEVYRQKNGRYPCSEWNVSNSAQPWINDNMNPIYRSPGSLCPANVPTDSKKLDQQYINSLPVDPLNTGNGIPYFDLNGYYYVYRTLYCGRDHDYYILFANLENKNDPERISAKNQKYCDGTDFYPANAGSVQNPALFVIQSE